MTTSLPLLSLEFLALSCLAVVLLGLARGLVRQGVFLAVNLVFLAFILLGPQGTASTLAFTALGYLLIRGTLRSPRWGLALGLPAFVLLFVYMRNYGFLRWFVPDDLLTGVLATIGLSFLLFKILHVVIEAQSGTLGEFDAMTYLNYSLNFTTFMMGPIQRYQDYRDQWRGVRQAIPLTFEAHLDAVIRILWGLFRAFVLAAWVRPYMMTWGSGLPSAGLGEIVVQVYAFYFFLYFNFAGYCDVAIGLSSLLGVRAPENFNHPYLSRNISDFWLRQHRSLTLWLTDYVFTPSLKSFLRRPSLRHHPTISVALALMVTMVVSGLWHGTTAGFMLYGLAHGILLVIYHLWDAWLIKRWGRKRVAAWRKRPLVTVTAIVVTFNATAFAFVFFQLGAREGLALFAGMLTP
jgi:D-alanyl-lipoteichoic acid acyltransferase DltB (MBOAT superfamily)